MRLDLYAMTPEAIRLEVARRKERRAKGLPLTEDPALDSRQRAKARMKLEPAKVEASEHEWRITLYGPPRTKKNHTTLGIRPHAAYRKWCADVVDQIGESDFVGPIPDARYNLAAKFFVDRYGKNADLIGLIQGVADALRAAKVVSDDKLFKGLDGCRRVDKYEGEPRCEITIKPLVE